MTDPEITPSDRFNVSRHVQNCWQQLALDRRRGGRTDLLTAVAEQVRLHGEDPEAICDAVVAYCSSKAGKDAYAKFPCNFVSSGMHLDPPESWAGKATVRTEHISTDTADRLKAERLEWERERAAAQEKQA